MTLTKFLIFTFLQWVVWTLLKVGFFQTFNFGNPGIQGITYGICVAILVIALVRRLGVINYLEAFFTCILWFGIGAFTDLIMAKNFAGLVVFTTWQLWWGYLAMVVAILIFHKKRHVAIRRGEYEGHGHH